MPQFGLLMILVMIPLEMLSGRDDAARACRVVQLVMLAAQAWACSRAERPVPWRGLPATVWPQFRRARGDPGAALFGYAPDALPENDPAPDGVGPPRGEDETPHRPPPSLRPAMPARVPRLDSPTNALELNPHARVAQLRRAPAASARRARDFRAWYVPALAVTRDGRPRTIHDFRGFPQALFVTSNFTRRRRSRAQGGDRGVTSATLDVGLDHGWGLVTGTWGVLVHVLPHARRAGRATVSTRQTPRSTPRLSDGGSAPLRRACQRRRSSRAGNVVHDTGLRSWGRSGRAGF